jgi:hypothetical protein
MIKRKIMGMPCDVGFDCPYWGHDEDGMGLCKCPEVREKEGRCYVYPYIGNLEICPIVFEDSPLDKWLKSLEKDEKE